MKVFWKKVILQLQDYTIKALLATRILQIKSTWKFQIQVGAKLNQII